MKKLLIIVALFLGFASAYAVDFNAEVSKTTTVSTKVIKPLLITNIQGTGDLNIPDVIKGQIRDLAPDQMVYLFKMEKDNAYNVQFHYDFPQYPVNGVLLEADWYFIDGDGTFNLSDLSNAQLIPHTGNWTWTNSPNVAAQAILKVKKIDATGATTTGKATFVINATGQYVNL